VSSTISHRETLRLTYADSLESECGRTLVLTEQPFKYLIEFASLTL
jgi:hypothetical protein